MKRSVCHYLAVLFVLFALPLQLGATDVVLNNTRARVFFSPGGGATKAILRQIGEAEREVLVEAYLFTSKPIQAALLKARKRGIEVEVILDGHEQKERKHVTARVLKAGGVDVWLDNDHASAHNKVMIIDRRTVITGSFNFTYAAEDRNAENLLIITSGELAALYRDNYLKLRKHSKRY
ncbi:MAG: phospholipase D family protein [Syntrophorhabdus sp.]|nr:phospholipase D family protein [Syntrophorhabdus sp.]